MNKRSHYLAALIATAAILPSAGAGELFAYPPAGRDQALQGQDKYECHQWAVEQSGFDPVRLAAQSSAQPGRQASPPADSAAATAKSNDTVPLVLGGAVSDGDVQQSATAGAAVGLLRARLAERKSAAKRTGAQALAQRAKQQQDQQIAQLQAKQQSYDRARGTCLKARGYTVSEG
jgi:hypothetical protein